MEIPRIANQQTADILQAPSCNTMHASTSAATTNCIHDTEIEKSASHPHSSTLPTTPNTTDKVHFLPVLHLHNTTPSTHQLSITKALGRRHIRFRRLNENAGVPTPSQVPRAIRHTRFRRLSDNVDLHLPTHHRYMSSHTTVTHTKLPSTCTNNTDPSQAHRIPQKQHIP